jgi:hypothetical protein
MHYIHLFRLLLRAVINEAGNTGNVAASEAPFVESFFLFREVGNGSFVE